MNDYRLQPGLVEDGVDPGYQPDIFDPLFPLDVEVETDRLDEMTGTLRDDCPMQQYEAALAIAFVIPGCSLRYGHADVAGAPSDVTTPATEE